MSGFVSVDLNHSWTAVPYVDLPCDAAWKLQALTLLYYIIIINSITVTAVRRRDDVA